MDSSIEQSLALIARNFWEDLYKRHTPLCEYEEDGLYLHLPSHVDNFTMADAMADELRDMGLDVDVLGTADEIVYRLRITKASLEGEGEKILRDAAKVAGKELNNRYRTNIEITPLPDTMKLDGKEFKDIIGYTAVVDMKALRLKVIDASLYPDRDGNMPDPNSETPLSTYSVPEWREKLPDYQLYISEHFQQHQPKYGYHAFPQVSQYGLKVSDGKRVPGYDRHERVVGKVLDSLVFLRDGQEGYKALIVPQEQILQARDGKYYVNGEQVINALSGLRLLDAGEERPIAMPFAEKRYARVGMGIKENENGQGQQLVIAVIQGGNREGEFLGMGIPLNGAFAELMKDYGCKDAISFDGGGASTLLFQNQSVIGQEIITPAGDKQGYRKVPGAVAIS